MVLETHFKEDFFREEKRCGYVVTEKQKKIWACEIDLAKKLLSVCEKYNIRIMGFAGTVLGAIRHAGFIPWDDDMDFCLLREDYNRLLAVASDEFKYPYFFQTAFSDPVYFFGYARLRNSTTTAVISGHGSDYNCGIFIDIFVLDGLIDDFKKLEKQLKDRDRAAKKVAIFTPYHGDSFFLGVVKTFLRRLQKKSLNFDQAVREYNNVLERYSGDSTRVSFLTHPMSQLLKYWIYKSDFDDIVKMQFANIEIPVPSNYMRILTNTYGDYLKFPPIEERGQWHKNQIVFDPDLPYDEYFRVNTKQMS